MPKPSSDASEAVTVRDWLKKAFDTERRLPSGRQSQAFRLMFGTGNADPTRERRARTGALPTAREITHMGVVMKWLEHLSHAAPETRKAVCLCAQGLSLRAAGARIGCSHTHVSRLEDAGIAVIVTALGRLGRLPSVSSPTGSIAAT